MALYRCLTGIDYATSSGEPRRAEAGDVVSDLPSAVISGLLARPDIEAVDEDPKPKPKRGA